jgi:hypothetical protein
MDDFKSYISNNNKSKFSYQTRTSSTEFCDALLFNPIELNDLLEADSDLQNELSKTIKDCNWYFLSWDNDPTIKSMLVMLDAIHHKFLNVVDYYERIVDKNNPIITFQFLNLKEFKLTDDLYIKMNARGKPLTSFENFKAKLEQLIANTEFKRVSFYKLSYLGVENIVNVAEYFSHKIDTDWANLFWQHRNKSTNIFDDQIMNFINACAVTHLAIKQPLQESINNVKFLLDNRYEAITFNQFRDLDCFDETYIIDFINLLDLMKNGEECVKCYLIDSPYYDEAQVFNNIINNYYYDAAYTARIQFYGYCQYLLKWNTAEGLGEWMRVIHNLSENTAPYNNEVEFIRSIKSINSLIEFSNNILDYMVMGGHVEGFSPAQIVEEKLKAILILRDPDWATAIRRSEIELKYFKGQLTFILSFAGIKSYYLANNNCEWDEIENKLFYDKFIFYVKKAKLIFDDGGLRNFDNYLFQRALLTKGDYLISEGSNKSFLINNDRDISWKRMLLGDKREEEYKAFFVKDLMDDVNFNDNNVLTSLKQIIEEFQLQNNDWRSFFIQMPNLIDCLGPKKYIRFHYNSHIYLLKRERMSGIHYEYHTFSMYCKFFDGNSFTPFLETSYQAVNGDESEPYIALTNWLFKDSIIQLIIMFNGSQQKYQVRIYNNDYTPLDSSLIQILTNYNFSNQENVSIFDNYLDENELINTISALTADLQKL